MIPHPSVFFDNPDTRQQELSMWKRFFVWLFKLAPGVIETIMVEKAKADAAKAGGAAKPKDTSGI